jgi:hypothetical protein
MRTHRTVAPVVVGVVLVTGSLLAHHDWPVDRTRQITITGTVTAFRWADPHVMITLDVLANGTTQTWNVGGSNVKYSAVNGWNRNTLKAGDVITAIGYRFRDGSNQAQLQRVVLASGKEMYLYGPPALKTPLGLSPDTNPPSTSGGQRP